MTVLKPARSEPEMDRRPTEPGGLRGGFLAPTKAWLSLRGGSLAGRPPSPGGAKDRSASPRRRLRESSADSDTQSRKSVTFGARERRPAERDPALPTVRRSSSLRGPGRGQEREGKRVSVADTLTVQNGSAEITKQSEVKKRESFKEKVMVKKISRNREDSKENVEVKDKVSVRSRDASKENKVIKPMTKESTLRSRDSSKDKNIMLKTSRDTSAKRKSVGPEGITNGVKRLNANPTIAAAATDEAPKAANLKSATVNGLVKSTELMPGTGVVTVARRLETQVRAEAKALAREGSGAGGSRETVEGPAAEAPRAAQRPALGEIESVGCVWRGAGGGRCGRWADLRVLICYPSIKVSI
jgi:hypothetical protein